MHDEEARKIVEPIVREVVDCIAEKRYSDIEKYAEFDSISLADFEWVIEDYLNLNELPYIDKFDVECNFKPQYEYHQLDCITYNDGSGFHMDYGLTTDSELNDLTLQMEFLFTDAGTLRAKILDVHVL